jgi:hypothetical protein
MRTDGSGSRKDIQTQEAWFPWLCAERMNVCFRGGRCGKERPAEEGAGRRQLHRRLEAGRKRPSLYLVDPLSRLLLLSTILRARELPTFVAMAQI